MKNRKRLLTACCGLVLSFLICKPVKVNAAVVQTGTNVMSQTYASTNYVQYSYSDDQLKEAAEKYYQDHNKGSYTTPIIEIESVNGNIVTLHLYEMVNTGGGGGHTATYDWYYIDRTTGKGTNFVNESVNLVPYTNNLLVTKNGSGKNKQSIQIDALAGRYQDSFSQRASMYTYVTNDGKLDINITWGNSASQTTYYHMTADLTSRGRLEYANAEKYVVTSNEDGGSSTETIYTDRFGYFTVQGNKLLWDGASESRSRSCVFEKMK